MTGREALLRPAHDAVTLIPLCTCILCALCVELPRRRAVQKGTNNKIKNGREIPAPGLNWQISTGGVGICAGPSIWQIVGFFNFSLVLVRDGITSFYF